MSSEINQRFAHLSPLKRALLAVESMQSKLDAMERAKTEPIAILGMGCRFPGGGRTPEAFWELLRDGTDAITEVPRERWDIDALYDPDPNAEGKMYTRWGGFLDGIDQFDPQFFGIAPREAAGMDPQQRLLLEVCWEALERAGQPAANLTGTRTGVFLGVLANDYAQLYLQSGDPARIDGYFGTGTALSINSGRISYVLGLQGPSMVVDTACSSSLVTVHLACQSLRLGESDLALAGGVNLILSPAGTLYFSRIRAMAADGRCKAFDAAADGFVRSEGCGVVVLKRLADALAAKDPILAVIRGSAVNQDGRSGGLTAPNGPAQEAVIRAALDAARIDAARVQYIEAHGTGTALGDPMEVHALGKVLCGGRPPEHPLLVGSVKTNIGHTEAAAGVAGLIKLVLSLQHGQIPASLHFRQPSPHIAWNELPLKVPAILTGWPAIGTPRAGGISSFGFSGTNAHLIVEEAPAAPIIVEDSGKAWVLPISARTPEALAELAERYRASLNSGASLRDLCYTAAVRRSHHEHRIAVAGASAEQIREQLPLATARTVLPGTQRGAVFVFPGQGGQWAGMARDLISAEPVFTASLEQVAAAIQSESGWNLLDVIRSSSWESIDVLQPTLFALQVALAALWRSWGVEPAAVIGHSMGEVAAAHVAGILSLEDAARIICRRSALLKRVRGKGAMAVVELTLAESEAMLDGYRDKVAIAVSNGPRSTVFSGDPEAIDSILKSAERRGIFCRRVNVDVASHSPQMDPLRDDLLRALAGIQPHAARVPFYTTVDARLAVGTELGPGYWVRNLREPVQFWSTLERLRAEGLDLFLELSPHPTLVPVIQECATGVPSLRRDEPGRESLLRSIGDLYCLGHPVDWTKLFPGGGTCVAVPDYPWQRERYWLDVPKTQPAAQLKHVALSWPANAHCWQTQVSLKQSPYLAEHRVRGQVVFPAAGHIDLVLTAGSEIHGPGPKTIEDLSLQEILFLPADPALIQIVFEGSRFHLSSHSNQWTEHVTGSLRDDDSAAATTPSNAPGSLADLRHRCSEPLAVKKHYQDLEDRELFYGPAFQTVRQLWRGSGEAFARLQTSEPAGAPVTLLDGAFQVLGAALPQTEDRATFLPVGIRRLHRAKLLPLNLWVYARVSQSGLEGDLWLLDDSGTSVVEVSGLKLQRLRKPERAAYEEWIYQREWQESEAPIAAEPPLADILIVGKNRETSVRLMAELEAAGSACTWASVDQDWRRLLEKPVEAIVHVAALDASGLNDAQELGCLSVLRLIQELSAAGWRHAPRLYLVASAERSLGSATLSGLARTLGHEHPELQCTFIDAVLPSSLDAAAVAQEILADDREDQIRLRGGRRYVARLHRSLIDGAPGRTVAAGNRPFALEIDTPGILDHLKLRECSRRAPGPGEVEIEVHSAGLNFLDVLSAMGIRPDAAAAEPNAVDGECSGTVVAVGQDVRGVRVGDAVIALAPKVMRRLVTTRAQFVVPKRAELSFEQAASLPIAYITALYALRDLARLSAGERVLIHSASGGVGMAAIRIAQAAGAEIFATAGTEVKRDFLRSIGIRHVMDSRSLDFAGKVLAATGGRGVDVVLNSLAGEAIPKSLEILAPYGRFVEIGKRDIYEDARLGLAPFRRNLSYFALDLVRMTAERPALIASLLEETARTAEPLPFTTYAAPDAAEAFRLMAQARHIGKIVVSMDAGSAAIEARTVIRPDATYAITGGLGGLGLTMARWLVDQGARDLLLIGRSEPSAEARAATEAMEALGAQVRAAQADVSNLEQMREALTPAQDLRGVIHAAGVLDDGLLLSLAPEKFHAVMRPKVDGAWNLHQLTQDRDLDFFVMYSSAASWLGSPGQGNYAAANSFLDALAEHRRSRGLPALSIAWGPWADVGLAAAKDERGARLAFRGMGSMRPQQAADAFGALLDFGAAEVGVMPLHLRQWRQFYPKVADIPLVTDLIREDEAHAPSAAGSTGSFRKIVEAAEPSQRQVLLGNHLREQLSQVLRLAPSRIDVRTPMRSLGIDSLMALELRNRLEANLGLTLSATMAWNYPTISVMAPYLAEQLGLPFDAAECVPEPAAPQALAADVPPDLDQLSEEEMAALLAKELEALEQRRSS